MHKSTLVGIFLAILELVRHHGIRAEQEQDFGEIWVLPGPHASLALDPVPDEQTQHGNPT